METILDEPKKILILEVNKKNCESLQTLLKQHEYETVVVYDEETFQQIVIDDNIYTLVLANIAIEYISIEKLKDLLSPYISLICVDAIIKSDKVMLKECFDFGADDYLKTPFETEEIIARIKYHINTTEELHKNQLRMDKLASLATIDQLSKSTLKMYMQTILYHELSNYKRYKNDTTVIYLGIVSIEKYIATFGLEKGEKMIVAFAKFLRSVIRQSDVLARWAGSEFIILLTHTDMKTSEAVIRKLKLILHSNEHLQHFNIELAFGITSLNEDDTYETLVSRVQDAYKQAKKQTYGKIEVV